MRDIAASIALSCKMFSDGMCSLEQSAAIGDILDDTSSQVYEECASSTIVLYDFDDTQGNKQDIVSICQSSRACVEYFQFLEAALKDFECRRSPQADRR